MTKHPALGHDQEEPQPSARSKRQNKVVSIKKDTKKPARQKATKKKTTMAIAEPLMMDGPSTIDNVDARIAERAYELYHHRGGHHGQDLDDWFTAEREVLSSEESCCS